MRIPALRPARRPPRTDPPSEVPLGRVSSIRQDESKPQSPVWTRSRCPIRTAASHATQRFGIARAHRPRRCCFRAKQQPQLSRTLMSGRVAIPEIAIRARRRHRAGRREGPSSRPAQRGQGAGARAPRANRRGGCPGPCPAASHPAVLQLAGIRAPSAQPQRPVREGGPALPLSSPTGPAASWPRGCSARPCGRAPRSTGPRRPR